MKRLFIAAVACVMLVVTPASAQRRRPSGTPSTPDPCRELAHTVTVSCDPSQHQWNKVDAVIPGTQGLRFWWHSRCGADEEIARKLAAEGPKIWSFMVEFMHGMKPLDDGAVRCTNDTGNGGGPQTDIFLRHFSDPSLAGSRPHPWGEEHCQQVPTFVFVDNFHDWAVLHELVHSISYAYAWPDPEISHCPDDQHKLRLWTEATASAADAAFAPGRNFRGNAVRHYLATTDQPLDDTTRDDEGYTIYQFPRYLDHVDHGVVGETWEALATSHSIAEAIAHGAGDTERDGFAIHWANFTKHLINEEPWDLFHELDNIEAHANPKDTKDLALAANEPDRTIVFEPGALNRLSVIFYRVRVGDGVRSLTFVNPNAKDRDPKPRIAIKALVRIADRKPLDEDWSQLESRFFCVDKKEERVTEIVLAVSNSTWEPGAEPVNVQPLRVIATNVGCWKFEGTASDASTGTETLQFEGGTYHAAIQQHGDATATFSPGVLPSTWPMPIPLPKDAHVFASTAGSANWKWMGSWTTSRGCSEAKGEGTTAITPEQGVIIYFNGNRPDLPGYRQYFGGGTTPATISGCGSSKEMRISWMNIREGTIPADGVLSGHVTRDITTPVGAGHHEIRWSLKPLRE